MDSSLWHGLGQTICRRVVLTFTRAANRKLAERGINRVEVESVVASGTVIREYPDDQPVPSRLVLGWVNNRPLHVVYAVNGAEQIIISLYEPDPAIWNEDFTRKV